MVPVLEDFLVTECGDGSKVSLCTQRFSVCSRSPVSVAFCSYFLFFSKLTELVSQQRESAHQKAFLALLCYVHYSPNRYIIHLFFNYVSSPRNWNSCALLVGSQKGTTSVENSMLVLRKLKMEQLYDPNNFNSRCLSEKIKSRISKRYLGTRVHYSSQPRGGSNPNCSSVGEEITKVWHTRNGLLPSLKKEGRSGTCCTMDET